MSERIAFAMQLRPGAGEAYRARHDAIWPELSALLKAAGISDYSIWLDAGTGALFAVLTRADGHAMDDLPAHPVMRAWWDHMADLMEVEADRAPRAVPLARVFHLP